MLGKGRRRRRREEGARGWAQGREDTSGSSRNPSMLFMLRGGCARWNGIGHKHLHWSLPPCCSCVGPRRGPSARCRPWSGLSPGPPRVRVGQVRTVCSECAGVPSTSGIRSRGGTPGQSGIGEMGSTGDRARTGEVGTCIRGDAAPCLRWGRRPPAVSPGGVTRQRPGADGGGGGGGGQSLAAVFSGGPNVNGQLPRRCFTGGTGRMLALWC